MRRLVLAFAFLALAACGGLGPRAQLAAADQSFTVVVNRLDTSCQLKSLPAARCADAQGYVRAGRTALDSAYQSIKETGAAGTYLDVLVAVTGTLEAILLEQKK